MKSQTKASLIETQLLALAASCPSPDFPTLSKLLVSLFLHRIVIFRHEYTQNLQTVCFLSAAPLQLPLVRRRISLRKDSRGRSVEANHLKSAHTHGWLLRKHRTFIVKL